MATEQQLRNRWGIAVAAVFMQLCLGAVYGWITQGWGSQRVRRRSFDSV